MTDLKKHLNDKNENKQCENKEEIIMNQPILWVENNMPKTEEDRKSTRLNSSHMA